MVQPLKHAATTVAPDIGVADGSGTQNVLTQVMQQIQKANQNIFDDLSSLYGAQAEVSGVVYIGSKTTNGSWRLIISGNNLSIQRLESGVWVEKSAFTP